MQTWDSWKGCTLKVHPTINPLVLHVKGALGPAFTSVNRNPMPSSPVRSDRNQIRPSPNLAFVAYLGRPWRKHGVSWKNAGRAEGFIHTCHPHSRPVPLLPHIPCFPGCQASPLAAGGGRQLKLLRKQGGLAKTERALKRFFYPGPIPYALPRQEALARVQEPQATV